MKNTIKIIAVFVAIATLVSCNMARFHGTPSKRLMSIPDKMTGRYYFRTGWFSNTKKDSIFVDVKPNGWSVIEKGSSESFDLSDNIRLYELNKIYILAQKDDAIKTLWNYWILEEKPGQLVVYPVVDETKIEGPGMSEFFPKMQLNLNTDGQLPPMEPKPGELPQPGEVPPGASSNATNYYMMSDENRLLDFFERKLKNKGGIEMFKLAVKTKGKK